MGFRFTSGLPYHTEALMENTRRAMNFRFAVNSSVAGCRYHRTFFA